MRPWLRPCVLVNPEAALHIHVLPTGKSILSYIFFRIFFSWFFLKSFPSIDGSMLVRFPWRRCQRKESVKKFSEKDGNCACISHLVRPSFSIFCQSTPYYRVLDWRGGHLGSTEEGKSGVIYRKIFSMIFSPWVIFLACAGRWALWLRAGQPIILKGALWPQQMFDYRLYIVSHSHYISTVKCCYIILENLFAFMNMLVRRGMNSPPCWTLQKKPRLLIAAAALAWWPTSFSLPYNLSMLSEDWQYSVCLREFSSPCDVSGVRPSHRRLPNLTKFNTVWICEWWIMR